MKLVRASCHCLRVQIDRTLPALMCSHCHCSSCRRVHAAAFVTWTAFPESSVRVAAGESSLHPYKSSTNVTRKFCQECGTHIVYTFSDQPDKVYIPRACIEGDLGPAPECHVNMAEHVTWVQVEDGLPRFDGFD